MIIFVGAIIILIVSLFLAIRALSELDTPPEVKKLIGERKNNISGVIVFFKKKIVHYTG
ncbi:hypothetical protein HY407_01120 [Candidatus Gottesmanbacteria bacterium]|nr:hypothetical protein [Candidatus Gottesmanbacteria bacterium]